MKVDISPPKFLMFIVGTRPEAIKMAPLVLEAESRGISTTICITGQQSMAKDVLKEFGVPFVTSAYYQNGKEENLIIGQVSQYIKSLDYKMDNIKPAAVFVQGDTTSAYSGALAAFYSRYPLIHIEAGLRTYKRNPFPEEAHRKMISAMADLHMCPTIESAVNLTEEGIDKSNIHIVGNTGIDAVKYMLTSRVIEPRYEDYILCTLHRRESFDKMADMMRAIKDLATIHKLPIKYITHSNPNVSEHSKAILSDVKGVDLIQPQQYMKFVELMAGARLILTDSGGLQEEGPFLGKRVLVAREETERPEAMTNIVVGTDPRKIIDATLKYYHNGYKVNQSVAYGHGQSSELIINIVAEKYDIT